MILKRNFWSTEGSNSFEQTKILFNQLAPFFNETIRTWLFIRNIDENYKAVSDARNEIFDSFGIEEPYFASTGIGRPDDQFYPNERIHLVALIVPGLDKSELVAMSNELIMPHTKTYNVRFERGMIYKNNYIISGTASIDGQGDVKYKGDLINQIHQALSNINSLLVKYGEHLQHANEVTGYVRHKDFIKPVKQECTNIFPFIKWDIKEGKICRPEWLVEFETIIISNQHERNENVQNNKEKENR